nr:hypothetical protein [Streptomyces sp. DSM 41633]
MKDTVTHGLATCTGRYRSGGTGPAVSGRDDQGMGNPGPVLPHA